MNISLKKSEINVILSCLEFKLNEFDEMTGNYWKLEKESILDIVNKIYNLGSDIDPDDYTWSKDILEAYGDEI